MPNIPPGDSQETPRVEKTALALCALGVVLAAGGFLPCIPQALWALSAGTVVMGVVAPSFGGRLASQGVEEHLLIAEAFAVGGAEAFLAGWATGEIPSTAGTAVMTAVACLAAAALFALFHARAARTGGKDYWRGFKVLGPLAVLLLATLAAGVALS